MQKKIMKASYLNEELVAPDSELIVRSSIM